MSAAVDPNVMPLQSAELLWSVIVITRNEEAVISSCLESIITAMQDRDYELIVVDSASTDRTVTIAKQYPVRIISIPATAPLRPSVGRHVGFQYSRGKWLLFIDGDSQFEAEWLNHAEAAFAADEKLAGVAGEMILMPPPEHDTTFEDKATNLQLYPEQEYIEADNLDGSAAYTRAAFMRAGGFNPHMRAMEEAELGGRLRKYGYRLRRLRVPMTRHFPKLSGESMAETWRRAKRGYLYSPGQFYRQAKHAGLYYSLPECMPSNHFKRPLQFFILMVLGVVALIVAIWLASIIPIALWLLLMVIVYAAFTIRSGSLRKPLFYFFYWSFEGPMAVLGYLKKPASISEFPALQVTESHGTQGGDNH